MGMDAKRLEDFAPDSVLGRAYTQQQAAIKAREAAEEAQRVLRIRRDDLQTSLAAATLTNCTADAYNAWAAELALVEGSLRYDAPRQLREAREAFTGASDTLSMGCRQYERLVAAYDRTSDEARRAEIGAECARLAGA